MSPQIGQTGQIKLADGQVKPGVVLAVDSATQVDVLRLATTNTNAQNLPYVEVGGTPPAGVDYFQEISVA